MAQKLEAKLTGDVFEKMGPDMDSYYFLLKQDNHEFLLSLENVLACLQFAEKEGGIPKIPSEWWSMIAEIYPDLEEPVDAPEEGEH